MSEKTSTSMNFLEKLAEQSKESMTDLERVRVAKATFLRTHKEEIKNAISDGYKIKDIVAVATAELLNTGLPKTFTFTSKEGKKITKESSFTAKEIKDL